MSTHWPMLDSETKNILVAIWLKVVKPATKNHLAAYVSIHIAATIALLTKSWPLPFRTGQWKAATTPDWNKAWGGLLSTLDVATCVCETEYRFDEYISTMCACVWGQGSELLIIWAWAYNAKQWPTLNHDQWYPRHIPSSQMCSLGDLTLQRMPSKCMWRPGSPLTCALSLSETCQTHNLPAPTLISRPDADLYAHMNMSLHWHTWLPE